MINQKTQFWIFLRELGSKPNEREERILARLRSLRDLLEEQRKKIDRLEEAIFADFLKKRREYGTDFAGTSESSPNPSNPGSP